MKKFKFKAKDDKAALVTGIVESSTIENAAKLVRQKGLIVISISPVTEIPINFIKQLQNRITTADVASFTRQLSTMINAGLPLTEALLILRSQSKGPLQKIVAQVLADVEEGEPLSTAMSRHPNAFNKTYTALVKSGELGGVMDEVLAKLSDNLEKQQEFRGKVKGALIYPIIIVFGMLGVAVVMLVFVIPRLTTIYDQFDADLPLSTKLLIGLSDFMVVYWPLFLLTVFTIVFGFKHYRNTVKGRKRTDEILLSIPIIGDLQRQIILTDLTRTLSLMVSSGVSILEALNISAQVMSNNVLTEALKDCSKMVEKGFPLAFAFSRHPEAFPFLISQMVAVGEETGKMDEVMAKVSHVFEVESEQKVKALTASIEPIILIFLGIGVGFLVISIILPIYNLTTNMSIQ
jgi:type IV pilus assembly protein PilC